MTAVVIEYNRRSGDRRVYTFEGDSGPREALGLRFELENRHHEDGWEIVSLVSDSIESIRNSHSRYFEGRELAPA